MSHNDIGDKSLAIGTGDEGRDPRRSRGGRPFKVSVEGLRMPRSARTAGEPLRAINLCGVGLLTDVHPWRVRTLVIPAYSDSVRIQVASGGAGHSAGSRLWLRWNRLSGSYRRFNGD